MHQSRIYLDYKIHFGYPMLSLIFTKKSGVRKTIFLGFWVGKIHKWLLSHRRKSRRKSTKGSVPCFSMIVMNSSLMLCQHCKMKRHLCMKKENIISMGWTVWRVGQCMSLLILQWLTSFSQVCSRRQWHVVHATSPVWPMGPTWLCLWLLTRPSTAVSAVSSRRTT